MKLSRVRATGESASRLPIGRRSRFLVPLSVMVVVAAAVGGTPPVSGATPASVSSAAPAVYTPPVPADYSGLLPSAAFKQLNDKFAREYAFTKWKGIDWQALYKKYAPQIARAQAAVDIDAYYLILRNYIHELRDGHVSITENPDLAEQMVGGGFGLIVTKLDNGQVVATWVGAGAPAALAGIKQGAQVMRWGGKPVNEALSKTSTVLGPSQPTTVRKVDEQLRYLVRAPIGVKKAISFRNPGQTNTKTANLTAIGDQMETLARTDGTSIIETSGFPTRMVEHKIRRGNVGYLRIYAEIDLPADQPGDHTPTLQLFRNAIGDFVKAKVSGIIVDVRSNSGGSDQMVADMMSSFYKKKALYEYQNYVVPATGKFAIWKADDVTGEYISPGKGIAIKPGAPHFFGPVVALVNNGCVSSGEGVAMGIKNLPNGKVVGFEGTNGSFGMVGDAALMPGGFQIEWPFGQSLNKNKVVQIDSRDGRGGVLPTNRVPMTFRNAIASANGRDVVLAQGLKVLAGM